MSRIYHHFQNLNENKKHFFHFRGWLQIRRNKEGSKPFFFLNYEVVTKMALRISVEYFDRYDSETHCKHGSQSWCLGLIFITFYLTFPRLFRFGEGKRFGFYVTEDWEARFFFNEPSGSSGGKVWYFRPLDILFGKSQHWNGQTKYDNYSPIHFKFRGNDYQLDKVYLQDWLVFRPRIPVSIWCKKGTRMDIKCDNPPKRAGKGENSWDCGDDATYGLSTPYKGPKLSGWNDRELFFKYAVESYCGSVSNSIKRYGRASTDRELPSSDTTYEYIGLKKINNENCGANLQ